MASANSFAPPPPHGSGPGESIGPTYAISRFTIPPSGDGSTAQHAQYSLVLAGDPSQTPTFIIRPISRYEQWLRTNESEAREYAEVGQQVFHGHNLRPVTKWNPPLRRFAPNTAFYRENENIVKVEQGLVAGGGVLVGEDIMEEDFDVEASDGRFGGGALSSGTTSDGSSYCGYRGSSSPEGHSNPDHARNSNAGSPIGSPCFSISNSVSSLRSDSKGKGCGFSGSDVIQSS